MEMSLGLLTCYRCCVLSHNKNQAFLFAALNISVVKVSKGTKSLFLLIVMICKHLLSDVFFAESDTKVEGRNLTRRKWICFDIKVRPQWDFSLEIFDLSFFAFLRSFEPTVFLSLGILRSFKVEERIFSEKHYGQWAIPVVKIIVSWKDFELFYIDPIRALLKSVQHSQST